MPNTSRFNASSPPRSQRSPRLLTLPLALVAATLFACSNDGPSEPAHEHALATITLNPTNLTLKVGETRTISTQMACGCGESVTRAVTWTSGDGSIASVSSSGLITAVGLGNTTVAAGAEGKTAQVSVSVVPSGTSVGPAGGTVVSSDGNLELLIPAGALAALTDVVIEPAAATMFAGDLLYIGGTGYQLKPDGLQLQTRAQLRLRYNPANVPPGIPADRLRIRERDRLQNQWRDTYQHQLLNQVVQAEIERFGVYAVAILPTGTMIGVPGGTVVSADGNVELEIPAGALVAPTDVVIESAAASLFAGDLRYVAGSGYLLKPDGLQLQARAKLRIRYDPAHLPAGVVADQLRLRERDRDQDQWRDTQQHQLLTQRVQGEIQQFGVFGLVVNPAGTMVGPAGATVMSGDGNAELVIPAGALAASADVVIEPVAASMFENDPNYIPGTGYLVKPDGLQLQSRAQLRIRYNPVLLPPGVLESQLRLRERDRTQNQWRATEQHQLLTQRVQGEFARLGIFAIVVQPPSGTLVGPAGGTVLSLDGNVELVIPAGALDAPTDVIITAVDPLLFAGDPAYVPGTGYMVKPDGIQLHLRAQLRIRYDPSSLPPGVFGEQLRLRERDRVQNQWNTTQQHQMLMQRVQGDIERFGTFGLVIQAPTGTMVGPAGGVAMSADGVAEMTIPPGALPTPTDVVITPVNPALFGGDPAYIPGTGYQVNPDGLQLQVKAQFRIRYNPLNIPPDVGADQLRLRERDRIQNQWRDTEQHQLMTQMVQGAIIRFGAYGIVIRPLGTMVGPAGGTVVSTDGIVELTIPAGSLSVPADVIIEKVSDSSFPSTVPFDGAPFVEAEATSGPFAVAAAAGPAVLYVKGTAYDIKPTGRQLLIPGQLKIAFDPANVPSGILPDQLRIRERDRIHNQWRDPSQCSASQGKVSTTITSLGLFAILAPESPVPGTVTVTPPITDVEEGQVIQLSATVLDTDGNVMAADVTWTSSDVSVAVVDDDGTVTGIAAGSVTITATAGTVSDGSSVNVTRRVASVTIVPASATVIVGGTVQLAAEVRDAGGNLLTRTVTWQTSAAPIATVSGGLVTGVAVGNAAITARVGTIADTANIIVAPPVTSVTISGSASEPLEIGLTRQLSATAYANGVPVSVTFLWTTSDASIATVDQTGLVKGTGRGTATITAAVGTVGASVSVRVVGESTLTGNNLSVPVVFADGVGITGLPVATDPGIRPTAVEGISVDTLPFWWSGNAPTYNTQYEQQTFNTWRPEIVDGTGHPAFSASVYWGDNLTVKSWSAARPIRVEQALSELSLSLKGFNMTLLYGSGENEMYGADGSVALFAPNIYTVGARLIIEKLDAQGGIAVAQVVDTAAKAEVNVAGKLIFGYNLRLDDWAAPAGMTKDGWYRLTFQLATGANLNITAVGNTEGMYVPLFSSTKSWIDIYVTP